MNANTNEGSESFDPTAWAGFWIMATCMALSFVFAKLSLEAFTVLQTAAGRLVIATAFLIPLSYLFGDGLPREFRFWTWCTVLGVLNFVLPFSLTTYGQIFLPTNVVGAMFSLIPLVTIALSGALLGVMISKRKFVGLFIGFLGLVLITSPEKWIGETGLEHAVPFLACLGSVICFAIAGILMRVMPKYHPFSVIGGSALAASVFGLYPFLTIFETTVTEIRPWVGMVGAAVLSTTIAYSLRFFLIRRKGPVFLAPNAYVGIILVNIFGVVIFGEAITGQMLIAFGLIIIGLFVALDSSGNMKQN